MHSAVRIAKHLIDKGREKGIEDFTPLKVIKMTYIAHGWMLALFDKPLFSEDVEAWKNGPVIPELYRDIKQYRGRPISQLPDEYTINDLSRKEEHIMDEVIRVYGAFTAERLVAITHAPGTPWFEVTNGGRGLSGEATIPNKKIRAYYKNIQGD